MSVGYFRVRDFCAGCIMFKRKFGWWRMCGEYFV